LVKRGLRQWFVKRFVVISEVVGYAISALVGAGVLYSLFVQVEVLSTVTGELRPLSCELKAIGQMLPVECLAASGTEVTQGQPVLRVTSDRSGQQVTLARRGLQTSVAMLEQEPGAESKTAIEDARRALAALPPVASVEILAAPSGGVVKQLVDADKSDVVSAGEPLAVVYDISQLVLAGPLGNSFADGRVAKGQEARVTVPELGERIIGQVTAVDSVDGKKTVSVQFSNISPAVRDYARSVVFGENAGKPNSVRAEIVVGRQSLFRQTFGRKQ
jgi:hypothetical protein